MDAGLLTQMEDFLAYPWRRIKLKVSAKSKNI
jgi:hypothetical protein